MKKKILVFAVHPDDETLGCGGTLLKHHAVKDDIYWVIATETPQSVGKARVAQREKEIRDVTKAFGFKKVFRLGVETTKLDGVPKGQLVQQVAAIVNEVKPHTMYLPFMFDVHSDHRSLFEAAFSCTKSFRFPFLKRVLMMETLSETDFAPGTKECSFTPNFFVDISMYLDKKVKIMKIYKNELGQHPFPRSLKNITALAHLRGATAGCQYAESFVLLKGIE